MNRPAVKLAEGWLGEYHTTLDKQIKIDAKHWDIKILRRIKRPRKVEDVNQG